MCDDIDDFDYYIDDNQESDRLYTKKQKEEAELKSTMQELKRKGIIFSTNSYQTVANQFLFRGIGKRAIRVVCFESGYPLKQIYKAALRAYKNGWKTIIIDCDLIDGNYRYTYNPVQWQESMINMKLGKFLF